MTQKKLRVGVLFGGRSAEHEVSIVSARSVMEALDKKKYEVVPIAITKQGKWIAGPNVVRLLESGAKIPPTLARTLPPDPSVRSLVALEESRGVGPGRHHILNSKQQALDVIIPILHGTYGEDGTVQGLLELSGIPYVGAGVLGSALGMDKIAQKLVYRAVGVPTPEFVYFTATEFKGDKNSILRRIMKLGLPLFVKPANLGSSIGISKVKQGGELVPAIVDAIRYDQRILVEKAVWHALEIEVAVLGNHEPKASVCGQIKASNEFYDYNAKYVDGKSQAIIPAPLSQHLSKKIRAYAVKAFQALDLAGMARADFLVNSKTRQAYLSEVNTIPGFTSISMFPKLWEASGLPYARLLDELISLALERQAERSKLATSFTTRSSWYRSS